VQTVAGLDVDVGEAVSVGRTLVAGHEHVVDLRTATGAVYDFRSTIKKHSVMEPGL
jgi:hypothetical protein